MFAGCRMMKNDPPVALLCPTGHPERARWAVGVGRDDRPPVSRLPVTRAKFELEITPGTRAKFEIDAPD